MKSALIPNDCGEDVLSLSHSLPVIIIIVVAIIRMMRQAIDQRIIPASLPQTAGHM